MEERFKGTKVRFSNTTFYKDESSVSSFLFVFETGSHYVAYADLKLMILESSECWDYRYAPLCLPQCIFLRENLEDIN
jgi:hypothetical protein